MRIIAVVPNLLSLLRLGLAAAFPAAPAVWHLAMVLAAGATDVLDGFIARRFDAGSLTGQLLDAVADKLFALSVLATLTIDGDIAWWQAVLAVFRDLVVAGVAAYTSCVRDWDRFKDMIPRVSGKVATAAVFAWFVTLTAPGLPAAVATVLFVIVAATSVWSGADYFLGFAEAWRRRRAALTGG